MSVCLSGVCGHYNSRWNYLIGTKFGTPFEGPKRKDEFVNQPFLTNGPDFNHKNVFVEIKNSIFPTKYTRHGINVKKENSHRPYFRLLMKNFIKNINFWFPKNLYEIQIKCCLQNCYLTKIYKFTLEYFNRPSSFCFNCKKLSKMKNSILYQINARYEKNVRAFMKIKNSIFLPKYTRYGKMLGNTIVYFTKIYNFGHEHFFIGVISFVYK